MLDTTNLHEPESIPAIRAETRAAGFNMASEPLTCSLLRTLAASKPAGHLLELGSGTGLSTAWLLDGMDEAAQLITIDNDETLLSILKRHLGEDPRLAVVCADAGEYLHSLHGRRFDFIFADAWVGKYSMLSDALELLNSGGIYVVDDMNPRPSWPEGHAECASDLINTLERLDNFHLTKLSWASGIIIAVKQ